MSRGEDVGAENAGARDVRPPSRPGPTPAAEGDALRRSSFLKALSVIGGSLAALLAGLPASIAFLSPALRRRRAENWVDLGEAEFFDWEVPIRVDIPQTVQDAWVESRVVRSFWLYTDNGEDFTAYSGRCPHLGCGFSYDEERDVYACPCHRGAFDVRTGEVLAGPPPRPLDSLEARVEDGILRVRYEDFRLGVPEKTAL